MDDLVKVVSWLFVAANAGRLLGYLPQIVKAWNCQNGASSVSRMTWGYFAFAHATGVLYAMIVIHDLSMALVFFGNFVVCCMLIIIVTWKKRTSNQAGWPAVDRRRSAIAAGSAPAPGLGEPTASTNRC
jgi:uncharacterized protein with PQ loop repeat